MKKKIISQGLEAQEWMDMCDWHILCKWMWQNTIPWFDGNETKHITFALRHWTVQQHNLSHSINYSIVNIALNSWYGITRYLRMPLISTALVMVIHWSSPLVIGVSDNAPILIYGSKFSSNTPTASEMTWEDMEQTAHHKCQHKYLPMTGIVCDLMQHENVQSSFMYYSTWQHIVSVFDQNH